MEKRKDVATMNKKYLSLADAEKLRDQKVRWNSQKMEGINLIKCSGLRRQLAAQKLKEIAERKRKYDQTTNKTEVR